MDDVQRSFFFYEQRNNLNYIQMCGSSAMITASENRSECFRRLGVWFIQLRAVEARTIWTHIRIGIANTSGITIWPQLRFAHRCECKFLFSYRCFLCARLYAFFDFYLELQQGRGRERVVEGEREREGEERCQNRHNVRWNFPIWLSSSVTL